MKSYELCIHLSRLGIEQLVRILITILECRKCFRQKSLSVIITLSYIHFVRVSNIFLKRGFLTGKFLSEFSFNRFPLFLLIRDVGCREQLASETLNYGLGIVRWGVLVISCYVCYPFCCGRFPMWARKRPLTDICSFWASWVIGVYVCTELAETTSKTLYFSLNLWGLVPLITSEMCVQCILNLVWLRSLYYYHLIAIKCYFSWL